MYFVLEKVENITEQGVSHNIFKRVVFEGRLKSRLGDEGLEIFYLKSCV